MQDVSTSLHMLPKLLEVTERVKRYPQGLTLALAHLLDPEMLQAGYHRIRKGAAVGVDGVDKEQYGQDLDRKIKGLHERLCTGRYRHQPIRRVHIPKAPGKTRPIGISTVEDKVVQNALSAVLQAVYEPVFLTCSYGFRPGRRAHDAITALNAAAMGGQTRWVLEADIQTFFDSIDRKMLMEFMSLRIADKSFLRLVGKCLHVGILDGTEYTEPDEGTVQGSTLSPILGNVYLHHVLDTWFEQEVQPRLHGRATLVRYADDLVICFERKDDADRVMTVLPKRMAKHNLTLHPEKTRLLPFHRPQGDDGGMKPETFDFLGFTAYWRRSRKGSWVPAFKTRKASQRKAIVAIGQWCRGHRHSPVKAQHAALSSRLRGHFNYFGINGNLPQMARVLHAVKCVWRKWLRRRSQRTTMTWARFAAFLAAQPLPAPRICVQIWRPPP
jgi:RNA-directed DNA polymerase